MGQSFVLTSAKSDTPECTSVAMLLYKLPPKPRIIKSTMPKYMRNGCTECVLCICMGPDKCKGISIRSVFIRAEKEKVSIR
jgi:hypothetical protein